MVHLNSLNIKIVKKGPIFKRKTDSSESSSLKSSYSSIGYFP